MPQKLAFAKVTLSYPLYACEFDPTDATRLVVGGGGGGGKSGVGNKITVLNTSNPFELEQAAEVDLSRDEDSVTSLAVGQGKVQKTLIFAGINSSAQDREKGKNEHFRIFGLEASSEANNGDNTATNNILELSRSALFDGKGKETYQRLVRLSKPFPGSAQLGATATAFGSKLEEIVLFDTTGLPSKAPELRGRIQVDMEAEDVDATQTGQNEYLFAYCTKYDIFIKTISSKTDSSEPRRITPAMAEHESETKPVFRSLRFLSSGFLLVLTNLYGRNGSVLQILRLPAGDNDKISQAARTRLPHHVRQATGLAICNLAPRASPADDQGVAQFVVAVAGHDMSICLYTMECQREGPVSMFTNPKLLQTLKDVHPFQTTGLALSSFVPPTQPTSQQNIKLASISAGNTVVVHTIPLSLLPKSSPPRYVVSGSDDTSMFTPALILSAVCVLAFAFFAQVALEVRGSSPAFLNVSHMVAPDVQGWIRVSHPIANGVFGTPKPIVTSTLSAVTVTSTVTTPSSYAESTDASFASVLDALISQQIEQSSQDSVKPVIIIREHHLDPSAEGETGTELIGSIKADLHDEAVHGPHDGKRWEDLTKEERERWTKKLKEAGHWTEDYVETVLKGVFWGVAGAAVGAAVGG